VWIPSNGRTAGPEIRLGSSIRIGPLAVPTIPRSAVSSSAMTALVALLRSGSSSTGSGRRGSARWRPRDRPARLGPGGARACFPVVRTAGVQREKDPATFRRFDRAATSRDKVRRRLSDLFGPGDEQVCRFPVSCDESSASLVYSANAGAPTPKAAATASAAHTRTYTDDAEAWIAPSFSAAIRLRHALPRWRPTGRSRRPNPPCERARPRRGAGGSRRRPPRGGWRRRPGRGPSPARDFPSEVAPPVARKSDPGHSTVTHRVDCIIR